MTAHWASDGEHAGPRAICPAAECSPWPVRLDATTQACQCWHPAFGAVLHGGHCCMRERVVCHAIPERYREREHCTVCGYPDVGTPMCGLCASPMIATVTA